MGVNNKMANLTKQREHGRQIKAHLNAAFKSFGADPTAHNLAELERASRAFHRQAGVIEKAEAMATEAAVESTWRDRAVEIDAAEFGNY
jgi:hypothetical protein